MIEIKQEERAGWCVVGVSGKADALAAEELEAKLVAAVQNNGRVAADLSALQYISSCGLRAVLQAARAAQARQTRFIVCSLAGPVKKVFEISGFRQVMEICEDLPC